MGADHPAESPDSPVYGAWEDMGAGLTQESPEGLADNPESLVSERDPLKIIADTIAATGVSDPALIAIASKIVHALAMDDYIIKYVGPT